MHAHAVVPLLDRWRSSVVVVVVGGGGDGGRHIGAYGLSGQCGDAVLGAVRPLV